MEISDSNIKNLLISFYVLGKKTPKSRKKFLIFQEMETLKNLLIFQEMELLSLGSKYEKNPP